MKLLLLTTFPVNEMELTLDNCKRQYHIFTFMLNKYLSEYDDLDITIKQCSLPGQSDKYIKLVEKEEFPETDFAILVDNRGFYKRVSLFSEKLREKVKYAMCTMSASNATIGSEDILFYMRPFGRRKKHHCKYIGWACDHTLCRPRQNKNKLRILIDHNYYGPHEQMNKNDMTDTITKQICNYIKTLKTDKEIIIRRFVKGGVETVDINNINEQEKYVQGSGLSYTDACDEYSKTDIFFVTHMECMGLSVLECAMAGALIVTPKGFIKWEFLRRLHHVQLEIEDNNVALNMNDIIGKINHRLSRKKASRFSWKSASTEIYNTFKNYDTYKERNFLFGNRH